MAANRRGYTWCYRVSEHAHEEWTVRLLSSASARHLTRLTQCLDENNNEVADYSLPIENESYRGTSGCTFTVNLGARSIAAGARDSRGRPPLPRANVVAELLASLTIMRYIRLHNL